MCQGRDKHYVQAERKTKLIHKYDCFQVAATASAKKRAYAVDVVLRILQVPLGVGVVGDIVDKKRRPRNPQRSGLSRCPVVRVALRQRFAGLDEVPAGIQRLSK